MSRDAINLGKGEQLLIILAKTALAAAGVTVAIQAAVRIFDLIR